MDFLSQLNAARILVAERDQDAMLFLCEGLEAAGYNVHRAYFAGDALFALQHNHFDAAVIDLEMAGRDQTPLVQHMPHFPGVRWIGLASEAVPAREMGAWAVLVRPVDPQQLVRRIEAVLSEDAPALNDPQPPDTPAVNPMLERRLIEQQTLSDLVRSLSAELSLDTLLTKVAEAAVKLCNAEEGMLLLPDGQAKTLYIRAYTGIDQETARDFRVKTGDTLAGQVFQTGRPILLGDQGWQKLKTEYLVQSLLYVPLSIKGEIIGVLGINNRTTNRTFTPHDMDLLQDLAAHAAIAIENARLYEDSIQRTRELTMLVEAGEAANSTLTIERVLSIIAGQLIGAVDVTECLIGRWHPDGGQLEMLAARYEAQWQLEDAPRLPAPYHDTVRQAFRTRLAQVLRLPSDTSNSFAMWMPHGCTASAILVPLFSDEGPLGLGLLYHMDAPFAQNALAHGTQAHIQSLALEVVGSMATRPAPHVRQSAFRTMQQMMDLVDANWCEVALWNGVRGTFNVVASYGEAIWQSDTRPVVDLSHYPVVSRHLEEQQPFTGLHDGTGPLGSFATLGWGKSSLAVPLVIKGNTYGMVLLTDTLRTRQFKSREISFAQALVLQAANALDNAHLFRELELSLDELRRTQSKLVQTARLSAMGELAAAVAHQINNPLTTILGDAEMLLMDLPEGDSNLESIQAISRAGKRAHEVVRRLLTMARQQSSDEPFDLLDVNETINNTIMLVRGHIQQGGVDIVTELAPDLPPVEAVPGQLEDVWLNLLLNARDAVTGREQPKIGITTGLNGDQDAIEITVRDNGSGIPPDQQRQIFEPFFTTKPAGEGTGLGLHICRKIVHKCKGSINVESTYNQGTRFIIHLPFYDRQSDEY